MLIGRHQVIAALRTDRPTGRLERSAYTLLSRIEAEGPMSIGQLAEAFGLDTSTINRQTGAMLRNGLVERIPDPDGGIARKLRITGDGLRRLHADRDWSVNGLSVVLADWPAEEVAVLARALARFNMSIEQHEGRSWPRPADGPADAPAGGPLDDPLDGPTGGPAGDAGDRAQA
ncbi:MarR family winged helix-turn-helix transcriptional regulator [Kitasatospora paranensis]|uniref:MarR family winged helix-turn-helix transcriptional regulator n=1 Tax=Kitasatospora paranensis TaxID=258053 RepID=A0ABW2FWV7_9ACTN